MMPLNSIDQYIENCPVILNERLQTLRQLIHTVAPQATECISYQMPTFKIKGKNFAHFAAYKNHIGFYPTPHPIEEFAKELSPYKYSKGAIQFPLDKPLPFDLIKKILVYRLQTFS